MGRARKSLGGERRLACLKKPLAVITGASAGIGATFARKLAARGYDLLLIARREDRLSSLASELAAAQKISADVMAADLMEDADRERVAEKIRAAKNLGLLVNNAGFGLHGFFDEAPVEGQMKMHRLHVLATVELTHAALANMVPASCGRNHQRILRRRMVCVAIERQLLRDKELDERIH